MTDIGYISTTNGRKNAEYIRSLGFPCLKLAYDINHLPNCVGFEPVKSDEDESTIDITFEEVK